MVSWNFPLCVGSQCEGARGVWVHGASHYVGSQFAGDRVVYGLMEYPIAVVFENARNDLLEGFVSPLSPPPSPPPSKNLKASDDQASPWVYSII